MDTQKGSHFTILYCSLPIICPTILHTTFSLKWGGGLYSNVRLVWLYAPTCKQTNAWMWQNHTMTWLQLSAGTTATLVMTCSTKIFPSLLVLPTKEWQQDNMHCCNRTGNEWKLGGSEGCLHLQWKRLLWSLSEKLISNQFYKRFTDYSTQQFILCMF